MSVPAMALTLPKAAAEIKPAPAPAPVARLDEPQAPSFEQALDEAARQSDPVPQASQQASDEQASPQAESEESAESIDSVPTDDDAPVPSDEDLAEDASAQGLTEGLLVVPTLETLVASEQVAQVTAEKTLVPEAGQQVLEKPVASASVGTQQAVAPDLNASANKVESTGPVAVVETGKPQPHAQGQNFTQQQDTPSQTPSSQQDQGPAITPEPVLEAPVKADTPKPTGTPALAPVAALGDAITAAPPVEVTASSGQPVVSPTSPGLTAEAQTSNDSVNTARIARGLSSVIQQNGGAVTLRLTPVDLGTIRIQLQIQSGTVNAQFQASTESARQVLTQQLTQLRSALEGQGLAVDRLSVQSPSSSSSSQAQQHADASPGDGRSRGEHTGQQGQSREQQDQGSDAESRSLFERLFLNEPTPAQGVAS